MTLRSLPAVRGASLIDRANPHEVDLRAMGRGRA